MNHETEPNGATPGDDTSGLILTNLTTRSARNAVEFEFISEAYKTHIHRAQRKQRGTEWLTDDFIREVHYDMLGSIWDWAGKYRRHNTNIGVAWNIIPQKINDLCRDFAFWDSNQSSMPVIEIAARLQNRLTQIHPFNNGNGRHARLITDIFFYSCAHSLPKWPQIQLEAQGHAIRDRYITAQKKADEGEHGDLIRFIEDCL